MMIGDNVGGDVRDDNFHLHHYRHEHKHQLSYQELHLKNLSMGSLLIILPFCPNLRKLTLKYPLR